MTTHQYKRCNNCGVKYTYQGSGPGCENASNDATWCSGCKQAVLIALNTIPCKFECRYRNIQEVPEFKDVTLHDLLKWEVLNPKLFLSVPIQRIWPAHYNLETGDSQSVREIVSPSFSLSIPFHWNLYDHLPKVNHFVYPPGKRILTGEPWPWKRIVRRSSARYQDPFET